MIYCEKCGTKLEKGETICSCCGHEIVEKVEEKNITITKKGICILITAIVSIVCLLTVVILNNKNIDKNSNKATVQKEKSDNKSTLSTPAPTPTVKSGYLTDIDQITDDFTEQAKVEAEKILREDLDRVDFFSNNTISYEYEFIGDYFATDDSYYHMAENCYAIVFKIQFVGSEGSNIIYTPVEFKTIENKNGINACDFTTGKTTTQEFPWPYVANTSITFSGWENIDEIRPLNCDTGFTTRYKESDS